MNDKKNKVNLTVHDGYEVTISHRSYLETLLLRSPSTKDLISSLFNNGINWNNNHTIVQIHKTLEAYCTDEHLTDIFENGKIFNAYINVLLQPILKVTKSDTTFFYTKSEIPGELDKEFDINMLVYFIGRTFFITQELLKIPIYEDINKVILIFNDCNVSETSDDFIYKGMYCLYKNHKMEDGDGFAVRKIDNFEDEIFLDNFIAKPKQNELSSLYNKHYINNNKNTALDKDDTTTNDLDTLEEQKDDPQGGRVGRDFKSVQWTEKVTPARLNSPDNEQVRMNFRTFPQIKAAIKKACKQSGEIQNEWIIRAALDRLRIDHPEIYKELESQKNEFPKVRHDAKHGVDLLIK